MPTITYVAHDGEAFVVTADRGSNAMRTACDHAVPGIIAECGGCMSCATCHVYVDPAWIATVGHATGDEAAMIESAAEPRENSRLSCQIVIDDKIDGLVLHIPETQI